MRDYYIHAYTSDGTSVSGRTVRGNTADPALDAAEALAEEHPELRFVVSNDEGRNLGAFQGDDFEYLGY